MTKHIDIDDQEKIWLLMDIRDYIEEYGVKDFMTELEMALPDMYEDIRKHMTNQETEKKLGVLLQGVDNGC